MRITRSAGVLAVAGVLALSGCSGTGQEDTSSSDSGSVDLDIAVITHGAPGDSFWDVVRSGADRAADDLGITVDYNSDPDPTRQAELIDNAVSQGVDGIVVSMANPDGLRDSVEAAVAAGIPVITINSGQGQSAEFGAITHVGQDETTAGQAVGTRLNDEGQTGKVLCVIHEAGNVGLEDRCSAVAATYGGQVENLQVDGTDTAQVQDTILSKLQSDPDVGVVLALQGQVAVAAVAAQGDAGTSAEIDTFDISSDVTDAITAGDITFAVDQQPYVQGYLPVSFLYLFATNGNVVGGGQPVNSGPAFITQDNAAEVAEFAANGTR
ncbi:MAG: substrate-binding domain-containing protein [Actinobacteria bacterium]|jgi:simple sugar transport system substrate-binding protein|uniref:Substrate-binding domain-containing protein n=2 Tax=root TaxID=1 RepID=A0ABU8E8W5_9ACTN|nr:substrate-binding domain-containing protein [Klenkia terrae]MSW64766.1 substrate-binding domain-containing protein [Actinomycetota bacterium]SSC23066.1 Periplasmic binding superfamily protein [Klenkia terrae]